MALELPLAAQMMSSPCAWQRPKLAASLRASRHVAPAFPHSLVLRRSPVQSQCAGRAPPVVAAVSAGQEGFARAEAEKLIRELPELLGREAPGGEDAVKAARVCAEALDGFLKEYSGEINPEAFASVKAKLLSEQFPAPYVDKVLPCLLGWSRINLYSDWSKWSASK